MDEKAASSIRTVSVVMIQAALLSAVFWMMDWLKSEKKKNTIQDRLLWKAVIIIIIMSLFSNSLLK